MLQHKRILSYTLLALLTLAMIIPTQLTHAAPTDNAMISTLPSPAGEGSFIERLFRLIFDGILGPVLGISNKDKSISDSSNVVKSLPSKDQTNSLNDGVLSGKVIIIDPGHGGHNPGAVANGVHEADVNLAVSLLLRDKLLSEGARVVMTRLTNVSVAAKGSTLSQELQTRVDIAEENAADLFVSIHANSNPDNRINGAMTFYPQNKSSQLARDVQNALTEQTGFVDKGIAPATFYVLRNTSMPSILVETGFLTNQQEAMRLKDSSYQKKIAQGVFNGIVSYLQS